MMVENNDTVLKSIKHIVSQILNTFGNDLEDILDNQFIKCSACAIGDYEKLLIIKALRFQGHAEIEWCVALGESLLRSVRETAGDLGGDWHSAYDSGDWREIFASALAFFEASEIRWFSPWIVHTCLDIYGEHGRSAEPFFSRESVLVAARANILLNPDDSEADCNMVKDHFNVVRYAVLELGRKDALQGGQKYPDSFSLINLKNKERQEYYNSLKTLKEEDILRFYEYLFDIYCATWSYAYARGEAKLWCAETARNALYEKYHGGRVQPNEYLFYYLRTIVLQLLSMIIKLYGKETDVSAVISGATQALSDQMTKDEREQALIWLIPQAEMSSYAVLVFSACILCRLETNEVTRETFMGIGNHLIRMIFLMLHEQTSFVNDDFKELINIMTRYEEPNNVILGFLSQILSYAMPKGIKNQIRDYLNIHRQAYISNLVEMTSYYGVSDGENLIHIIMLTPVLKEEEKASLYNNIRNRMAREFFASPRKAVCDELVSILADKKISPSLDGISTEEIVQKLCSEYSPNTAYILYDGYLSIDRECFLPYCPMIAPHLLCSTYSGCWRPVFLYFTEMTHEGKPEECNHIAWYLYFYCRERGCSLSEISSLQSLILFLKTLLRKRDIFQWVDEEKPNSKYTKCLTGSMRSK